MLICNKSCQSVIVEFLSAWGKDEYEKICICLFTVWRIVFRLYLPVHCALTHEGQTDPDMRTQIVYQGLVMAGIEAVHRRILRKHLAEPGCAA